MIESIPTNVLILILFVFGSIFGSFFNVVIYRLPKDESIVFLHLIAIDVKNQ